MLAEAVLASYKPVPQSKRPGLSVTSISKCPYATYLAYWKLAPRERTAQEMLLMDDGWYQEAKILDNLRRAGYKMRFVGKGNQLNLHVGRNRTPGHPDGLVLVDAREDLLEIKAMNLNRYTQFRQSGLELFGGYEIQIQAYMDSDELRELEINNCRFYVTHKDTTRPYDLEFKYNPDFIKPIIEVTDKIVLEGFVPRKEETKLCVGCYSSWYCWETELVDFSNIEMVELPETAEKWRKGKAFKDLGTEMVEEARKELVRAMGTKEVMYCEGLKVSRIESDRWSISVEKFVEQFGAAALDDVGVEKHVTQVRVLDEEGS